MKKVQDLFLGHNDAENYKKREHKELFAKFFTQTNSLNEVINPDKYFIVGDKGTGKTAMAVFMSNSEYKGYKGSLKYIRETEYQKFISMKKQRQLTLSDYQDIWKVIFLLLIAKQIETNETENVIFSKRSKFKPLKEAIEEFYKKAFSPEIIHALTFAEDSKLAAELLYKYVSISAAVSTSETFSESRFQVNFVYSATI
jgi:hypothetical protein